MALVRLSVVPGMEDGSPVKTMSDVSDLRRWRLVRHTPLEGVVLGFLYASAPPLLAAWLPCGW